MPRLCNTDDRLPWLLAAQDCVITSEQCLALGLTGRARRDRVKRRGWQRLLPGVFLSHEGEPSRRQLLIAALLYAGEGAAIDADDACRFHGVLAAQPDERVIRVVVPIDSPARSHAFVRVRRSTAAFGCVKTAQVTYLEPAAAVIAAGRLRTSDRSVLALLSDAVQRRIVTPDELLRAHVQRSARNAVPTDRALEQILAGVRSAPEGQFRLLAEASLILPPLLYNRLVRLPCGLLVSPDALDATTGLVHETNGRKPHQREDLFEDMQVRHDLMTESGLTVLHNSPRRIWLHGREVIAQVERTHLRLPKDGLPPGVILLPECGRSTL